MRDDRHPVKVSNEKWVEIQRILQRDQEVDAFLSWLVSHPDEVAKLRAKMRRESEAPPG